jgi:drug/metabolite transporter (DMT)-like permease
MFIGTANTAPRENLMLAVMFGLFAAFCWSLHDLVARTYASDVGPYRMAIITMLAGGLLLTGIVLWDGTILHAGMQTLGLSLVLGLIYGLAVGSLFMAFSMVPLSSFCLVLMWWDAWARRMGAWLKLPRANCCR